MNGIIYCCTALYLRQVNTIILKNLDSDMLSSHCVQGMLHCVRDMNEAQPLLTLEFELHNKEII